jgi:glycosyltransferase involved in cell wall biosynthesis
MANKEILFMKMGSFSLINNNVHKFLVNEYPNNNVIVYDIKKHKLKFFHYIINLYFFVTEYGVEIISGKKKWEDSLIWFFATSYVSLQLSRQIRKKHKNKDYLFTFQTQSLFNGKLKDVPHFVYTDHTTQTNKLYPDIDAKHYMKSNRFIKKAEIKIYEDATMIFTFGSLISWSLINQYEIPESNVVTAFAGSNVLNESPNNLEKYAKKNILFVGVEWERKGGPMLLKIFENILAIYPDATLTIVGCSPKISLSNCKVVGKMPLEEVAKYYNNASVFCLPTLREPFGIVFIEAMKFRLPIIANNIGSLPDLVKNDYNGYLINNSVKDYTDAICTLFENPAKCKQMGENGYNLAESKFSWPLVGKSIRGCVDQNIRSQIATT